MKLVFHPPSDEAALAAAQALLGQARRARHPGMEAAALSALALIRRRIVATHSEELTAAPAR